MSLPGRNGAEDASIYMARSLRPSQDTTESTSLDAKKRCLNLKYDRIGEAATRHGASAATGRSAPSRD